jgi:hypothetical protein
MHAQHSLVFFDTWRDLHVSHGQVMNSYTTKVFAVGIGLRDFTWRNGRINCAVAVGIGIDMELYLAQRLTATVCIIHALPRGKSFRRRVIFRRYRNGIKPLACFF